MSNIEKVTFGILFLNNDIKNNFILDINNSIKNQKYEGNFCENIENIITKNFDSSWNNKIIFKINCENIIETKKYRIIFNNIKNDIYYFEKNGAINFTDKILKKYNFLKFKKKLWKNIVNKNKDINHNDKVIKYIEEELFKEDYNTNVININNFYKNYDITKNNFILNNEYDYYNIESLFYDIKELENHFKLPLYINKDCIDSKNKNSETVYNNLVFNKNPNKYVLLDRKILEGCEIADLYDKENKLMFHNKKNGDLRVLAFQIIIGALIMKNKEKNKEYLEYLKKKDINEIIDDNFKYVVGIICMKGTTYISQKDKLSLGLVNYILKAHNIELLIDYIRVV